jgi:hypothetical protein
MNSLIMTATVAALAFTLSATPAAAQGSVAPVTMVGSACPSGYGQGSTAQKSRPNPNMCYPRGSDSPSVYVTSGKCAAGYRKDFGYCTDKADGAVYTPPTFGSIMKANAFDRCPVGYHTSEPDVMKCVSYDYSAGKQPATRAKKGGACASNEVDEWGLWCTSKLTKLTRKEAEQEAVADVNHLFPRDGKGGNQGADYMNTPGIVGIFGAAGANSSGASSSSKSGGNSETAAAPANPNCTSPSSTGAALGGALGGDAGAALGSMLGGLGKKKKKAGC